MMIRQQKVRSNDSQSLRPQPGEDDELQSVYEQLAAAQAEIVQTSAARQHELSAGRLRSLRVQRGLRHTQVRRSDLGAIEMTNHS